jgi:endonuclease V-like protein UPF0215 family
MSLPRRPHTLGIDDGPFEKRSATSVPLVGVMMEGPDLVECVARTEFPVDGADATAFLIRWIGSLRARPALHAVLLGGITIAGLGIVDIEALAEGLGLPVLSVSRKDPSDHRVASALRAAGLLERLPIVERSPAAQRIGTRLYLASAGIAPTAAATLLAATQLKSDMPEPVRLAHLIAAAFVRGESHGRV